VTAHDFCHAIDFTRFSIRHKDFPLMFCQVVADLFDQMDKIKNLLQFKRDREPEDLLEIGRKREDLHPTLKVLQKLVLRYDKIQKWKVPHP